MERETEVVIVGTGAAGLFCALQLPQDKKITIITKDEAEGSDSFLAQGGICMLPSEEDYEAYYEDTMRAGHYQNNPQSVGMMIRSSRQIIEILISYGVEFEKLNGQLAFTREGGHSRPRILFHEDITGKEITGKLLEQVKNRDNITIYEYTEMIDLLCENQVCCGVVVTDRQGNVAALRAQHIILASGGIGGLYRHSTNFSHLTGDALAVALRHKILLKDVNFVQIHPTTLYSEKPGRRFLISESVRGEGAVLYNAKMERFVDELQPRDIVTEAIKKQMKADGMPYVWLSMERIDKKDILGHFPNIYKRCLKEGYDVTKECIPVVPGQHYFMGGIQSDLEGRTSMERLYAIGETSCNGVHGANRLASNSLLESLVFARRAALDIAKEEAKELPKENTVFSPENYTDIEKLHQENRKLVRQEIERMKQIYEQQHNHDINVDELILSALQEDISSEDVTTNAVMPKAQKGEAQLICKQDGVLAGLFVFRRVFELLDQDIEVRFQFADGDQVKKGDLIGIITGDIRAILSGERTALNYLQRMSGIATYTNSIAALLAGSKVKLLDTRKTTPNNRIFEKYAVKTGGGFNHRYNLSDGVLLKDNHIGAAGGVKEAVQMAKEYAPFVRKIEIECETVEMVRDAVEAGADIIMLDNMGVEEMKEAIALIDGRAEIECSGNVTKENIEHYISLGVDYISSGALTHSAPIMDISLKNLHTL